MNKRKIFVEDEDYRVFLNLIKRYLSKEEIKDAKGRPYQKLFKKIDLLAYCLMPNHFHLLLYQYQADGLTDFLHRIMTAYSSYFNKKYKRLGGLFQGIYKASNIDNEAYLWHISRYIHLNPKLWKSYPYSSLPYYLGKYRADWINPGRLLAMFKEYKQPYEQFLLDYRGYKATLDEIKRQITE